MSKLAYILASFMLLFTIITIGCDSPTESKAVSVTAPVITEPVDNATGVSLTPNFKWTGSADKLEYATNSNFTGGVIVDVSGTEYTPTTPLNPNTTYFWKAGKTNGASVVWCDNWRFSTGN